MGRIGKAKQIGTSNRKVDGRLLAKFPGKRRSKSGKTYYESRRNRSDVNRKTRI